MSIQNSRAGFEFGCTLFYAAHWFHLEQDDVALLVCCVDGRSRLTVLVALVDALREANPDGHNASIEQWCSTALSALDGASPAQLVKNGRAEEVLALVKALGKLPSCDEE